jgi:hypothetical protein
MSEDTKRTRQPQLSNITKILRGTKEADEFRDYILVLKKERENPGDIEHRQHYRTSAFTSPKH